MAMGEKGHWTVIYTSTQIKLFIDLNLWDKNFGYFN